MAIAPKRILCGRGRQAELNEYICRWWWWKILDFVFRAGGLHFKPIDILEAE
jgi:hypothetical protein